jgi:hypothetical protein
MNKSFKAFWLNPYPILSLDTVSTSSGQVTDAVKRGTQLILDVKDLRSDFSYMVSLDSKDGLNFYGLAKSEQTNSNPKIECLFHSNGDSSLLHGLWVEEGIEYFFLFHFQIAGNGASL